MIFRLTAKTILLFGLATVLLVASGCTAAPEAELVRKYQRALETFDQAAAPEDYLRSAALYQEIIDRGVVSGALLYNQGNAYMRAGQRGRAIACYRQAARYRPRDPQLQANLQLALGSGTPLPADRSSTSSSALAAPAFSLVPRVTSASFRRIPFPARYSGISVRHGKSTSGSSTG